MTIELTCFDENLRRRTVDEQFFDESEWDQWKLEQRNAQRLEELLKWHEGSPTVSALSKEQFGELLANEEQKALDETFARADKKQIDTYMPLYFWLADEKRAVFAIGSLSDREYGFLTLDRQIISALIEMRNRYHRCAANPPAP